MKKFIKKTIFALVILVALFLFYYVTLPAFNIHSAGFWWFSIGVVVIVSLFFMLKNMTKHHALSGKMGVEITKETIGLSRFGFYFAGILFLVFIVGTFLSSPVINSKKYQSLLDVETREFTADFKQADYNTVPLLDKDSATLLGNRKMGSMVEMVSQFEVSDDYTQINVKGRPVRVSPLVYASTIKWLTNQKNGIPAYIQIDMSTQNTECIKLDKGIKYSESEHLNRNIYRHLRFRYPTAIFADQIFFEIDDEGTPFWICPVKKFNVGLFGGATVGSVIVCNAVTGECVKYNVDEVPTWIDKVYQAELLMQLYDYYGTYKHGYFNSILGQKDCLQTTNGYNYIAMDDDVWVYSGVTSVSGDQSNVGFVMMNQRTMETRFYQIEGAIEDSAMGSAEGQVQNLGYKATFPLMLNISGEPTYFMALKDDYGLVKKYAMVNIQKYQWVAIGDTVEECEKEYTKLLNTNGITSDKAEEAIEVSGKIKTFVPVVIEGNTHIYFTLEGKDLIFDADVTEDEALAIIKYKEGDQIKFSYAQGYDLNSVIEVK